MPSGATRNRRCAGSAEASATSPRRQGVEVSQKLVGRLLRDLKYSCQANRKTREGSSHPDRNAQFGYINATVKAAVAAGEPAISVDTKKTELVGDFKNPGREVQPRGDPEPVRVHCRIVSWLTPMPRKASISSGHQATPPGGTMRRLSGNLSPKGNAAGGYYSQTV